MSAKSGIPSSISSTRLPLPSRSVDNSSSISRNSKRPKSDEFCSSPEKKPRLEDNLSYKKQKESHDVLPVVSKRAPPGKLRRSVSMAHIQTKRAPLARLNGRTTQSKLGSSASSLAERHSSVTASIINRAKINNEPLVSRRPLNYKSKLNTTVVRRSPRSKEDCQPQDPPAPKGKQKRAPWDLKGRLLDMETLVQENRSKIHIYDSKIADLLNEKESLSENLEKTKSTSSSAQEELIKLREDLRASCEEVTKLKEMNRNLKQQNAQFHTELSTKTEEVSVLKSSMSQLLSSKVAQEAQYSSMKTLLEETQIKAKEFEDLCIQRKQMNEDMHSKLVEGEQERRKLHNHIQELKGNIRVFCRVRPMIESEILKKGKCEIINFIDEKTMEIITGGGGGSRISTHDYSFDRVFTPAATQEVIFEEISQLAQSALDGYNVCVFAYGQTGSGKTFTMEGEYGSEKSEGMIPRAVKQIFQSIEDLKDKGWEYTVSATFLEIYNESIRDLLASDREAKNKSYDIKMTEGRKHETYVTNLKIVMVSCASQVHRLLTIAQQHRAVAATNMNERSSRSHSIFSLKIMGNNEITRESCEGKLNLVDLAGSERLKDSGSEGARLTETQSINRSLSNLGNVMLALGQKQAHIPYRNSKLTHLLQNSLGGNSKTLMFVNVSPTESCYNETVNSLRFATSVNQCHIGVAVKREKK